MILLPGLRNSSSVEVALAENFIQPFKSQGAADVDDVGIIIRGKFTTKPGAQWVVRKEIYSRVQKAFEENGIDTLSSVSINTDNFTSLYNIYSNKFDNNGILEYIIEDCKKMELQILES